MASKSSGSSVTKTMIQLQYAAKKLSLLPSSTTDLLHLLNIGAPPGSFSASSLVAWVGGVPIEIDHLAKQLEEILSKVQQSPSESINDALNTIIEGTFAKELVRHADVNVNISVACCICEIMRIMAPKNPYSGEQMKDLFEMVVITFEKLSSANGGCYANMTKVLKTFNSNKLWVMMLDLKLDGHGLIVRLFKQFLTIAWLRWVWGSEVGGGQGCRSVGLWWGLGMKVSVVFPDTNGNMHGVVWEFGSVVFHDPNEPGPERPWLEPESLLLEGSSFLSNMVFDIRAERISGDGTGRRPSSNSSAIVYEMEKIMTMIIDENEEFAPELLSLIVTTMKSDYRIAAHVCWQLGEKVLMNYAAHRIPNIPEMGQDMSIALYDYSKMVARVCDTTLENEITEAKETIPYTTHKIKLKCRETLKSCQDAIRHEKESNTLSGDPPKSFTKLKGKRKRNNSPGRKQVQSVEHGENLVGSRIKVWWPADRTYYPGVVSFFDFKKKRHKVLYDDGDAELLNLKRQRWKLLQYAPAVPGSLGHTLPETVHIHGYNVKQCVAPVLEAIINKHGDIAAKCVFKADSIKASLLELVCDIVRQLEPETDGVIDKMEEIENQVSSVEKANINVSWLRAHLEAINKTNDGKMDRLAGWVY
ncbi:hypothetical protein M8C21_015612 [Ambrosia artemisiifolia]|uniref:Phospholipase-like protein n=1 Tax=Ambrosia artemisiifolia TaxID=4212 RepID=A0AAD5BQ93_AMBAR|nr:hypothetical protein M8C21_015612 [Ambrosia artemisiifolia]